MWYLTALFLFLSASVAAGAVPERKAVNLEELAPKQCRGMVKIPAGEFFSATRMQPKIVYLAIRLHGLPLEPFLLINAKPPGGNTLRTTGMS
ncbi:MAG: hypothetical protein A2270_04045 [Elusimicrobia bacterium RIFOXYA12_FULL_51_18]|nr:MAG: hypothetical protein A2270_04045 [Elusimicrobia bacterium RIFOXYA12_FULL_51_18]OGS33062.1 MAG: hypothetical protein A2218_04410 [Elusimicrobia bacterium RIFOXYA2_FULL_53_38]